MSDPASFRARYQDFQARYGDLPTKALIDMVDADQDVDEMFIHRGSAAVRVLLEALPESDPDVQLHVIAVLGAIGDPRAVEPLISLLQTSGGTQRMDEIQRIAVIEALKWLGDRRAVPALITILQEDPREGVRTWTIEALGALGDSRAIEPLLACLQDPRHAELRAYAAMALGDIGAQDAERLLLPILQNRQEPERLRGWAAIALGKIGNRQVYELLLQIFDDSREESWIRSCAALGLGELSDRRAFEPLLESLLAPAKAVFGAAIITAFGALRDPRAIESLANIVTGQLKLPGVNNAKYYAVEALGASRDPRAVEPLRAALNDPLLAQYARNALAQIEDSTLTQRGNRDNH